MNSYDDRQNARRERLLARADKSRAEAADLFKRSGEGLPPAGEPIKIGHHSEGRHRRALERSWQRLGKSVAADKAADQLEQRAESVGKGGISSDDPEAIAKLQTKLAKLVDAHEHMKAANKAFAKGGADALRAIEPDNADALLAEIAKPWHYNKKKVFPSYALTNNLANIKQVEKRIADLKAKAERKPAEAMEGAGWRLVEDTEDNRYRFEFDGKPADAVRTALKANGFKWSPNRGAWVRQITGNARYAVDRVIVSLPS